MTGPTCCPSAIEYHRRNVLFWAPNSGPWVIRIQPPRNCKNITIRFCPWCGERLPTEAEEVVPNG